MTNIGELAETTRTEAIEVFEGIAAKIQGGGGLAQDEVWFMARCSSGSRTYSWPRYASGKK